MPALPLLKAVIHRQMPQILQLFGVTAIPVNFVSPMPQYRSDGSLSFQYTFSSSSGNLSDLSNCLTGETAFYPPSVLSQR